MQNEDLWRAIRADARPVTRACPRRHDQSVGRVCRERRAWNEQRSGLSGSDRDIQYATEILCAQRCLAEVVEQVCVGFAGEQQYGSVDLCESGRVCEPKPRASREPQVIARQPLPVAGLQFHDVIGGLWRGWTARLKASDARQKDE